MVLSVNERTGGINQRLLTLISVERKIELSNLKTEKKKNRAVGIEKVDNRLALGFKESLQELTHKAFQCTCVCLEVYPAPQVFPAPRSQ